jgi:acetoacetate decarboxylase
MLETHKQTPTSYRSLKTVVVGEHNIPFQNASLVLLEVPLNRHEVKKILPLGLWPANPPMATLFFADYPIFPYGVPYREAVMMVHVRTPLGRGIHCNWILVDNDVALIGGRDFLGYPKKLGEISFTEKNGVVHVCVTRRGIRLMTVNAERKAPEYNPGPVFSHKNFNLRGPADILTLNQVLFFKPREVIHESFEADAELFLSDSVFDPIAGLVAGAPLRARMVRMDILLPPAYIFPVGYTGGWRWFLNTFNMRFR